MKHLHLIALALVVLGAVLVLALVRGEAPADVLMPAMVIELLLAQAACTCAAIRGNRR